MSEALQTFSYHAQMMDIQHKPKSVNYMIPIAEGVAMELERGNDFGVIPGTKKPSLYKAGAEKICMSLGLSQQYELVSHIEDPENGFFSYTVRCALVKIVNGQEYTSALLSWSAGFPISSRRILKTRIICPKA